MGYGEPSVFLELVCHARKEGIIHGAKNQTDAKGTKASKFKKEGQPKDIEDVTERYVHMFTEERESDVVKKVHMKVGENTFYLVSLIEHKSNVDYNVVMQILRYMVFIWEDYEREMNRRHEGISRTKDFRYN